ncbi:MAG: DedA family protein [Patescibacteria group bacterium]
MVTNILTMLAGWIVGVISAWGYAGVLVLMMIESACMPLPSEVIMPFAGYLVWKGELNFWLVSLMGAAGCLVGSIIAYVIGYYGGRPVVEKYGRYVLISKRDMDMADRWFARWGEETAFLSRLLPVIRGFISLPLGIMKVNFIKFAVYTFVGSFIWSAFLAYLGWKFGENWTQLKEYFHQFDLLIGIGLVGGLAWYIWRHFQNEKR